MVRVNWLLPVLGSGLESAIDALTATLPAAFGKRTVIFLGYSCSGTNQSYIACHYKIIQCTTSRYLDITHCIREESQLKQHFEPMQACLLHFVPALDKSCLYCEEHLNFA